MDVQTARRKLAADEAAEYLGVSRRTLDRLVAEDDAPPRVVVSAQSIHYRQDDLDAWIESRVR